MSFLDRCRDRWVDFHPLWRFLLVLALLAGLAFAAGKPSLGVYRQWRTGQNLKAAQEALQKHLYSDARERSIQVLQSDATRQDAIPVLLRATDALSDPRRAEVAQALLAGEGFAADDRAFAWQVVCRSSPAWMTMYTWSALPASDKASTSFITPLFDRMLREDMETDAALLLQEQKQPLPPELDLRLMQLLVAKQTDEALHQFQKSLIARLAEQPDDAEPWVAILDQLPQASLLPGTFGALSAWQEKRGTPDVDTALRLARCEIAAAPQRAEEIFTATLARHRDAAPLATARWCLQTRHLEEAEALLAKVPPDETTPAFELRRLICEQSGRLDAWSELLANPPPDADRAGIQCERAHLAVLMKDPKAQSSAENEALRIAEESLEDDALVRLARHAESRKLNDFAQRSWVAAIRKRVGPLPLATRIKSVIEGLAAAKKEAELLDVLTAYRFIEPGNPVVIVQQAYLSCINGRTPPASLIQELTPIHERLPDSLPVSCVLALAHLLESQAAEALALTDGDEIDWFAANPSYRAIRAIALAGSGRSEEAAVYLEDFPWDALLSSEKRVLRGLAETSAKAKQAR